MKKLFFIFLVSTALVSCEMGDPLDPAKGIDSQGDSTLFSGIVTISGVPALNQFVECINLDWNGNPTGTVRWNDVKSDGNGKYYKRDNLMSAYYGVRVRLVANTTVYKDIHESIEVDYDSARQSPYDPVIIVDLQI